MSEFETVRHCPSQRSSIIGPFADSDDAAQRHQPARRDEFVQSLSWLSLCRRDQTDAQGVRQEPCTPGAGIFTVEELRPAAGAACAARLISDIEAISLADHEESAAAQPNPTASLILLDGRLTEGPAAGTAWQDENQNAGETNTQGGDGIRHVAL
jgi:hypothetical protein